MIIHHVRPKRRSNCFFCGKPIEAGEQAIRFRTRIGKDKKKGVTFFRYRIEHWSCFIAFSQSLWDKHPAQPETRSKGKVIPAFRSDYAKIMKRVRYYRSVGKTDKEQACLEEAKKYLKQEEDEIEAEALGVWAGVDKARWDSDPVYREFMLKSRPELKDAIS